LKIKNLHGWDVSIRQAKQIQQSLARRLILEGRPETLNLVAGADVSYSRKDQKLWAGVVVFDLSAWEVVEEQWETGEAVFPYVPGYLSFREMPVLLRAFGYVRNTPDVVLIDGQGTAHPRSMGLASHIGLFLDVPTIGCAKSRLIGEYKTVELSKGSWSVLRVKNEHVGWVLRTRDGVKPIFVSPGHRIGLDSVNSIVLTCCRKYRIPEPSRRAHRLVTKLRQEGKQPI
jgi:deoxyribonuclease V